MFKNKSNRFVVYLAVLMLVFSAGAGFFASKLSSTVLAEKEKDKTQSGVKVIDIYIYTVCGEKKQSTREYSAKYEGLTKDDFKKYSGEDGRVTDFSSSRVVITHCLRQYCREHYILFLENEKLVVKRYSEKPGELLTVKDLGSPLYTLSEDTQKRLKKGVVFSALKDAESFSKKQLYE